MKENKFKIVIRDLPEDEKISQEQMRKILGGRLATRGYKEPQPGEPNYPKPYGPWVWW